MKIWLFGDSHTVGWAPDFTALAIGHEVTSFGASGTNSHHWQNGLVPGQEQNPGGGLLDLAFEANSGSLPDLVVYAVGANDGIYGSTLLSHDPSHPDVEYYAPDIAAGRNRANMDRIIGHYGVPAIWCRQGVMEATPGYTNSLGGSLDEFLCDVNIHLYQQWDIERHWPEPMVNLWLKQRVNYTWDELTEEQRLNGSDLLKVLTIVHHGALGRLALATRVLNAVQSL
jgi:hypothetical protein